MKSISILIAGFGGQGTLFAGKVLASASLEKGLEVTWLPSYGPEMRGGTANCSVIISDSPIGSPIVSRPEILIALNKPSFEKYEKVTVPGGRIFVDSSLVDVRSKRSDIEVSYIPASKLAAEAGGANLSNITLLGSMIAATGLFTAEDLESCLDKMIPERKAQLRELNKKALKAGIEAKSE